MKKGRNAKKHRAVLQHPSIRQMEEGLKNWQEQFPARIRVSSVGKSLQGRDVFLCKVTDFNISDSNKQTVLITCIHAARELNSTTSSLHFLKWLLGNSPLAKESRKKQIILVMPACSPDAYEEVRGPGTIEGEGNPCLGYWSWSGVLKPEKNPEAVAVAQVMEKYKPDVHISLHGFPQKDAYMAESTGISWGSGISRAYVSEIPQLMRKAADEAGFALQAVSGEDSAGMVRATAPIDVPYRMPEFDKEDLSLLSGELAAHHFFIRPANILDCVYSYHRYHSLSFVMEIGFEQAALVQLQKLLEIGNGKWLTEYYPGYPVNQMGNGLLVALTSYGVSAEERRRSRVEIWDKLNQFCFGFGNPPHRGELIAVCSTTPAGAQKFFGIKRKINPEYRQAPAGYPDTFDNLLKRISGESRFDMERLTNFIQDSPVGEYMCFNTAGTFPKSSEAIAHGLGIRLFIPYRELKISQVLLDGQVLKRSERDGYISWCGSGTTIQVNIPPQKVQDFHIIITRYEPGEIRPCGFSEKDWKL